MPQIVSALWDFGDGTTSTDLNPSHSYAITGMYYIVLTVTDDNSDTATRYWGPIFIDYSGVVSNLHYDFGDGSVSNEENPTHSYSSPATYTARLYYYDEVLQATDLIIGDFALSTQGKSTVLISDASRFDEIGSNASDAYGSVTLDAFNQVKGFLPGASAWHPAFEIDTDVFTPLELSTQYDSVSIMQTPYSGSETYQVIITIDSSKISGTNTNFPILITEANLPAGFWGHVVDADGLDIRFYDSNGTTELNREIVLFDSANQKLEAWVQKPTLSSSNRTIYMRYGGTTRVNDTSAWDNYFKSVYHLHNSVLDSTQYDQDLTNEGGSNVSGKIQNAISLDGVSNKLYRGFDAAQTVTTGFTIEAWIKWNDSESASNPHIISFRNDNLDGNYNYILAIIKSLSSKPSLYTKSLSVNYLGGNTPISVGVWTHIAGVYDGSYLRIYINGVQDAYAAASGTIVPSVAGYFAVGAGWPTSWQEHYKGLFDEVRLSNVGRSAGWILTEYNNQNDPATFYSCGAEATSGTNRLIMQV
jgi:PKD repeat protein